MKLAHRLGELSQAIASALEEALDLGQVDLSRTLIAAEAECLRLIEQRVKEIVERYDEAQKAAEQASAQRADASSSDPST